MSGTTDLPASAGQRVLDAVVVVTSDLDLPQVLRRMGNAEQDARIRELEAELARLDADPDGADPRS